MSATTAVRYRFEMPDGSSTTLDFVFSTTDFRLLNPAPAEPPYWTELEFNRCANCPLAPAAAARCPAALHMADPLARLADLVSFDTVRVTVTQPERTVYAETSAQQAVGSVIGLIMATAGCPWTDRFRPMARFHLPFASETETTYRTLSMFLLAAVVLGEPAPVDFADLERLYANLHLVNRAMARRLGAATRTDPARNALALLDSQAVLAPVVLGATLEEWKPLFAAWRRSAAI